MGLTSACGEMEARGMNIHISGFAVVVLMAAASRARMVVEVDGEERSTSLGAVGRSPDAVMGRDRAGGAFGRSCPFRASPIIIILVLSSPICRSRDLRTSLIPRTRCDRISGGVGGVGGSRFDLES